MTNALAIRPKTTNRLRGLAALLTDAVAHGASAIERVHMATASRPFVILEAIPVVAPPTRVVRFFHDTTVKGVYGAIRLVTRAVGKTADFALANLDSD
jgi:hypothetical protein